MTFAVFALYSCKAAIAFSADDSWVTPTTAFRMRMVKITAGSTNAVQPSPSSNNAKTKEIAALPSRMMTS